MKSGSGKNKGGVYERLICKQLSLWASKGERTDIFWRSSMSGGRATIQRKKGIANKTQCCDISAIDPLGSYLTDKFVVECKHYKDLKIDNLLYNTTKEGILQFWNETRIIAEKSGKEPILIARQNGKKDIICIPDSIYKKLEGYLLFASSAFYYVIDMHIYILETFLKMVPYDFIITLSKTKELNEKNI